jgi:integrase
MNYRRLLIVLFNYAVRNGYCERNPADLTVRPRLPETEIGILTPEQTASLLEVTEGEIQAFLAIGAFAGLRRSEIERLEWNEVDLDGRLIEVAAKKAKTASRRFVRVSENLAEWLDPLVKRSGMVCPSKERLRKVLLVAREDARITEWPNNALRHSYASYHLAKHRDAPALALELGHTTTNLIFRHYRRLVRPEDAERYWEICP